MGVDGQGDIDDRDTEVDGRTATYTAAKTPALRLTLSRREHVSRLRFDGDRFAEPTPGAHVLAVEVDPTLHGASSHRYWLCGGGCHKLFSACGLDADQQAAVSTGATATRPATRKASPPNIACSRTARSSANIFCTRDASRVGHYEPEGVCQWRIAPTNCSGASDGTKWPAP